MLSFYPEQKSELIKRLHGKYVITINGCWEWCKSLTKGGYPIYRAFCVHTTAHRISYAVFIGDIKDGMHIDHLCKNIKCINPKHLEQVSPKTNQERALKAMQTHCIHGHEFTIENTYRKKSNKTRVCKMCAKLRQKRGRIEKSNVYK